MSATSNAGVLLKARSEGVGITVSTGSWASSMYFIGASASVSFFPNTEGTSFMIEPDDSGVVAVSVNGTARSDQKDYHWQDFFLPIEREGDGRYFVRLDDIYVPGGGRIGQIVSHRWVMVQIDGEFFSNEPDYQRHESIQYVPNPNLLCRYLAGKASAEDVKAAVVENEERKRSALRAEQDKKDIALIRGVLKLTPEAKWVDEVVSLSQLFGEMELEHQSALDKIQDLKLVIEMDKESIQRLEDYKARATIFESYLSGEFLSWKQGIRTDSLLDEIDRRIRPLIEFFKTVQMEHTHGRFGFYGSVARALIQCSIAANLATYPTQRKNKSE